MRNAMLAAVVMMVGAGGALAQSRPVETARQSQQARENEGSRLLRASRLPRHSQEVRDKGVPDDEVRKALRAAKDKKVSAGEMADVAAEHSRAIDDHGPTDNFGAFVKGKLDEGLRGRELAVAIRAEHAARGKGKGAIKNRGKGNRGGDAERRRDDEVKKDAKDREKEAKDREKAARDREKDAKERAEKDRGKGGQGGGRGKGKN